MVNDVFNQILTLTCYYNAKTSKVLKTITPFWIRENFKKPENPHTRVRTISLAVVPVVVLFIPLLLVEPNLLLEMKLSKLSHKKYRLSLG